MFFFKSSEVPPSGRGDRGVLPFRRYVSLREPHLRLCTFASPRRVPSGHEGHRAWGENREPQMTQIRTDFLEGMTGCGLSGGRWVGPYTFDFIEEN